MIDAAAFFYVLEKALTWLFVFVFLLALGLTAISDWWQRRKGRSS